MACFFRLNETKVDCEMLYFLKTWYLAVISPLSSADVMGSSNIQWRFKPSFLLPVITSTRVPTTVSFTLFIFLITFC